MITGDYPWENHLEIGTYTGSDLLPNLVSCTIRSGGDMMPYKCRPEPGTATINLYYAPGATIPTDLNPGSEVYVDAKTNSGTSYHPIYQGVIADVTRRLEYDDFRDGWGTFIQIYCADIVGRIQQIRVPGVITSATTKNQTWEQRITDTLGPYFPSGTAVLPNTAVEDHIYRLVDNNIDGSLYDQICLACDSVGATWYVAPSNSAVYFQKKGDYVTSGALFTDEPGYWNVSNYPLRATPIEAYNLTYKTLEMSFDSRNLINQVTVENVMPKNMITRSSDGVLLYKDPATTRVDALATVTPTYTASNNTSINNYGRRPGTLQTNLYPYRTTDSESFYIRYNATPDPYCEYQNPDTLTSPQANTTFTTTSVYSGTYSALLTLNAGTNSFPIYAAEPIRFRNYARTGTINTWRIRMRAPNATTTVYMQAEFQDSYGNILAIYSPGTGTLLAANTWTQLTCALPATSIPAGATYWRPRISMNNFSGSWTTGTAWRFDEIEVNPHLDTVQSFSGDTPDTAGTVFDWEAYAGQSWSLRLRNILDNIASDALTYLKDGGLAPRYLEWNIREDWAMANRWYPGGRVDIRFNGSNYRAWIDTVEWEITPDNALVKLELSRRPSSWN